MELTREEQALVRAVYELQAELGADRAPDTEASGKRVSEILRTEGGSYTLFMKPPWYGTHDAARRLQELALLEIDPGMATAVGPGQPTPITERLWLVLTAEGRQLAEKLALTD